MTTQKANKAFQTCKRHAAKYNVTVTLAATYYGWSALRKGEGLCHAQGHIKIEPNGTATLYTWDLNAHAYTAIEVEGF